MLFLVSAEQVASARCQQATLAQVEFKKLVYESIFTKYVEGMNFVTFSTPQFCSLQIGKIPRRAAQRGRPKIVTFPRLCL
jgi:hypothetical protein